MNRRLYYWEFFSMLFVISAGTLLHFLYKLTGNVVVSVFSAVNESTWEHLKIFFFPFLIFAVVEYFKIGKMYENFIPCKTVALLSGLAFIIIAFYTYTGVIGKDYAFVDILIFVLAAALSSFLGYKLITKGVFSGYSLSVLGIFIGLFLFAAFAVFTFCPPQIALFSDPITGT